MTYKLKRTSGRNITDNDILDDIKRVDAIVNGDFLTKTQFSEHSSFSVNTAINRFGSWHDALTKAGLTNKSKGEVSKKLSSPQSRNITNAEIIAELKRVANELDKKCITRSEFDNSSRNMTSSTVTTRFGSWETGLTKASLELSQTAKRYSEQECFENILNVWEYYGKQPTQDIMSEFPSIIRAGTYKERWGSWYNALKAFVEFASKVTPDNTEDDEPENNKECVVENAVPSETIPNPKRSIGWRLRYQVLNRDKFKCVLCGDSPATNIICKLHVDHVFPFVKGGKTDLSNLRTLCHVCNIGKGDTTLEFS
jgi:hypothetical protein